MTTLAQKIEALTDANEHTEAAIQMALALGGKVGNAFGIILEEIADGHELVGYTEEADIALRDQIARNLRDRLQQMGQM